MDIKLLDTTTEEGQREASVMLARLIGWILATDGVTDGWWLGDKLIYPAGTVGQSYHTPLNLYDPANMSLAWQVLNWAGETQFFDDIARWATARMELTQLVVNGQDLPPDKAQRAWLDKILSLAIQAGMVDAAATE